ncbi:hypothetical protein F2P81_015698 [Scophthalmus maximus]|uniref:Uncharacterized protein n=1 Tax=Scophthalmus maximus TaxID=52904 RepID=A0A6A4SA72_SCOMX|nr:hypothetical protein F2P81_015698 [Scophthalmus maximus]
MNGHSGGSNSWTRRFVMGRLRNTTTVSHIVSEPSGQRDVRTRRRRKPQRLKSVRSSGVRPRSASPRRRGERHKRELPVTSRAERNKAATRSPGSPPPLSGRDAAYTSPRGPRRHVQGGRRTGGGKGLNNDCSVWD